MTDVGGRFVTMKKSPAYWFCHQYLVWYRSKNQIFLKQKSDRGIFWLADSYEPLRWPKWILSQNKQESKFKNFEKAILTSTYACNVGKICYFLNISRYNVWIKPMHTGVCRSNWPRKFLKRSSISWCQKSWFASDIWVIKLIARKKWKTIFIW